MLRALIPAALMSVVLMNGFVMWCFDVLMSGAFDVDRATWSSPSDPRANS